MSGLSIVCCAVALAAPQPDAEESPALPATGVVAPLSSESADDAPSESPASSPEPAAPLGGARPAAADGAASRQPQTPLGERSGAPTDAPPDRAPMLLVRPDLLLGPAFRPSAVDAMLHASVEVGREVGLSGSLHLAMLIAADRDVVRAFDVPIGVGAIGRLRFGKTSLYGSVGLTAGILVHRARVDDRTIHRVDPDLGIPVRLAWTLAGIGTSLAVVPAFSVRERSYVLRGIEVWSRPWYRIAVLLGIHWDVPVGSPRRTGRRR